jgi:hypothetical protein
MAICKGKSFNVLNFQNKKIDISWPVWQHNVRLILPGRLNNIEKNTVIANTNHNLLNGMKSMLTFSALAQSYTWSASTASVSHRQNHRWTTIIMHGFKQTSKSTMSEQTSNKTQWK